MTTRPENGKCPLCGGTFKLSTTLFSVETGEGVIVVRNVPAEVCVQCGEEWIPAETARELEQRVQTARQQHHPVEVVAF
jgi:YgiT-type zinc finger domain-containing protein